MNPSVPPARRSNTLSSSLGLGEKLFASSDERRFATAIEKGLDEVEAGLLSHMAFADEIADANSVAILTGDLLFARASKLIAGLGSEALILQSNTFERLCLGQLHETLGPKPDENPVEHYLQVLADKTGSLIATAAEVGVMFSNAPREYTVPVRDFGEKIGVAFQLIDDVIDLSAETGKTGKKPGTDLRSGVATLPLLYLRELALTDSDAAELLTRIERDVNANFYGEGDEAAIDAAVTDLREHPVTKKTLDEARRWGREAVEALAPLPDGSVKKALTRFAESIVERSN